MGGPQSNKYKQVRQIGLLSTIPMLLAAGPLVGYFFGAWLDRKLGTGPYIAMAGVGLGLVAGVRETILILRRASQDSANSNDP